METKATSIEISVATYDRLRSLQDQLEKILRKKKVSFDQVLRVMFAVARLDDTLIEMQLE